LKVFHSRSTKMLSRQQPLPSDADTVRLEHADELGAGELAALIGVEDLRFAVAGDRLLERFDTEVRRQARTLPRALSL
jgi:hypothetical protein